MFVAGMSLLLFAVFIIGVMVGTHIDAYPEKIAQSIPAIIRRQLSRPAVTVEKVVTVREETKQPPISEENNAVAPLPDPFVAKDDVPGATAGAEEKKSRPAVPAEPGVAAKNKPAPAESAAVAKNQPDLDVVPDPPEAKGKYSLQVASFKTLPAAKQFGDRIIPLGFKTRVAMVELPTKGKWYRVMADGFASQAEAQQAAVVLAKKIKGVTGIVRSGK